MYTYVAVGQDYWAGFSIGREISCRCCRYDDGQFGTIKGERVFVVSSIRRAATSVMVVPSAVCQRRTLAISAEAALIAPPLRKQPEWLASICRSISCEEHLPHICLVCLLQLMHIWSVEPRYLW